jgi:acyl-CoA thioester hydrolase
VKRPKGATVDVDLEVPFHDVDSLRIVWHGNYYKYAEIGRTALLRTKNLDVAELTKIGHGTVVIETRCRHTHPLRYADRFRVRSWFEDIEHRVNIGFEIVNLTAGKRAAHGHTILASLDAEGGLLLVTPEILVQRLR